MSKKDDRIAELVERIAALEARITWLEARPFQIITTSPPQPYNPFPNIWYKYGTFNNDVLAKTSHS